MVMVMIVYRAMALFFWLVSLSSVGKYLLEGIFAFYSEMESLLVPW